MNTPFPIQPMDRLGAVDRQNDATDVEGALGHVARGGTQAAFLGVSISPRRRRAGLSMAFVILGVFLFQTLRLQVVHGQEFLALAEGNRIQEEYIPAHRGLIYDRQGALLVRNQPTFSLWLDEVCAMAEGCYVSMVDQLAELLDITEQEMHATLLEAEMAGGRLLVAVDVSHEAAMRVLAAPEAFPSLTVESDVKRGYQAQGSATLSALLGYVGLMDEEAYEQRKNEGYRVVDRVGQAGLEVSYESLLRGFPGERRVEVNARGEPAHMLSQRDAQDGANLTLHIDAKLQRFIEERLVELERTLGVRNASVVVQNPQDGAVRALVSYPGFDANVFSGTVDAAAYQALLQDPAQPLFPRAVAGQFPSGSTFKPVVAAAALDEGIINEHTSVVSTGGIRIGQFFFPDWRAGGHGSVDVGEAIANSVNTFFYMIGGGYRDFDGLGLEPMMRAASRFGLGEPLGIDLSQEASGFLPSAEWKERVKNEPWYIGDTYHVAIGQGDILVTPLQIAAATSVFANGGTLYRPQIVDHYEVQGRRETVEPRVLEARPAKPESINIVRQGLRRAVTSGSARRLSELPIEVAGKTGTAEWHSEKPTHAWFTGFAPYQDPTLTVTVLVEEGGEGSAVAVPLAYDIFEWWFQHEQYE
ncbi:MAG: penicillin-binding protein 2 [Patescibacteria group bacterium]